MIKICKHTVLLATIILLVTPQYSEAAEGIGVKVSNWFTSVNGTQQSGTEIDFKNTLGVANKSIASISLSFGKKGKFGFNYNDVSFKANKALADNCLFEGRTYTSGSQVSSKLSIQTLGFDYLPQYNAKKDSCFSMVYGLRYYSLTTELDSINTGNNKRKDSAILPIVGFRYDVIPEKSTSYYAELAGMATGNKSICSLELGFSHDFSSKVTFSGGYRYLQLKAGSGNEFTKANLSGPFAQINYKL